MNNPTGTAFQQNVVSSHLIHPEKLQEEEKLQESKNIDLRSWFKLRYAHLFFRKLANVTERRKIIAFAIAASFLLFSFWNSLNQNQLQRDLAKSNLDETLFSGEISDALQDHAEARKAVVVYMVIDANGKPVIPPGTPMEIVKQLQSMRFDPPKRNGIAVRVKIPILLSIR